MCRLDDEAFKKIKVAPVFPFFLMLSCCRGEEPAASDTQHQLSCRPAGRTFFKLARARLLEVTTMEDINIQKAHVVFPVRSFC